MPSVASRALLLELSASMVHNNIRRGVLQVAANFQASNQEFQERSKTLQPGEDWTFSSLPGNTVTVIRSSNGPVDIETTVGLAALELTVPSLMVYPDVLGDIVFKNPGTATRAVLIHILQV